MIRRAEPKDAPRISALLRQVLEVHASARPDMFKTGTQKYSEAEVVRLMREADRPIFVETDENDRVRGYAFCAVQTVKEEGPVTGRRELYIDDLCVDEAERRKGVAKRLYLFVKRFAAENGFDWITLNVWNDNTDAMAFYRAMGLTPRRTVMEMRVD